MRVSLVIVQFLATIGVLNVAIPARPHCVVAPTLGGDSDEVGFGARFGQALGQALSLE